MWFPGDYLKNYKYFQVFDRSTNFDQLPDLSDFLYCYVIKKHGQVNEPVDIIQDIFDILIFQKGQVLHFW